MTIRSLLAGAAVALAAAPALAEAPEGWAPLLEPSELASILDRATGDEIRILQVNQDHADGYIPGAVRAPYAEWRGPAENPGALPDLAELHEVIARTGIEADIPVVVVHAGTDTTDFGSAARVYWTLKSLGVEDLAILDGGLAAWKEAGLPVEREEAGVFASDWQPDLSDKWRVTSADLAASVESGETAKLVDARPLEFFEGRSAHGAAGRPGTLPGAENLSYEVWFEDDGSMVSPERARAIAEETGQTEPSVAFCNTGHWAAINWFALSELAGIEDTRMYAESMVDWSQSDLPMMNQPSRLEFYWQQVTDWVDGFRS